MSIARHRGWRVRALLPLIVLAGCGIRDAFVCEMNLKRLQYEQPATERHWAKAPTPLSLLPKTYGDLGLESLIVARHGKIAFEWARDRGDQHVAHNIKSVSKLVLSALVGIAQARGELELDAPIESFAGCRVPPELRPLTARHLMNMSAGFAYIENADPSLYSSKSWSCAALARPIEAANGARFNYGTIQSYLLGVHLVEATGQDLKTYADAHLFGPLGIALDGWVRSPEGYFFAGSEMWMSPRDMLALGQLYLDQGRWQGRQIVPRKWVASSANTIWPEAVAGLGYGQHLWQARLAGRDVLLAHGYGGQVIAVEPVSGLVLVATAPTGGLVTGAQHDRRLAGVLGIFSDVINEVGDSE